MKKSYLIAAAMLSTFVALPAVAGPDWQVIHDAENYQASHEQQASIAQEEVMPLDHGPRALTTPWMNQQERAYIVAHQQKKDSSSKLAEHKQVEQQTPSHG